MKKVRKNSLPDYLPARGLARRVRSARVLLSGRPIQHFLSQCCWCSQIRACSEWHRGGHPVVPPHFAARQLETAQLAVARDWRSPTSRGLPAILPGCPESAAQLSAPPEQASGTDCRRSAAAGGWVAASTGLVSARGHIRRRAAPPE